MSVADDTSAFAYRESPVLRDFVDPSGIHERPYDDTVRVAQFRYLWTISELYAEQ
jgi:hypothetical protein